MKLTLHRKQSSARRNMRAQILKNAGSLVRAQL